MRRIFLVFFALIMSSCPANEKTKRPSADAVDLFARLPNTTAAIFAGDKAQAFWKDSLFWRLRFLTLFQFSAQRGFFSSLSEAANQNKFAEIGLDPAAKTALVLDSSLLVERYQPQGGMGVGARVVSNDYSHERSPLSYAVLPLQDQELLQKWLTKTLKAPLAETSIAQRPALLFGSELILVVDGPLLYVFPVGLRDTDQALLDEHPLDGMKLFRAALEEFFANKEPLAKEANFIAAREKSKPQDAFFFIDAGKLSSLLSKAKTLEWYRVILQDGETPARVEVMLSEKNKAQSSQATLQSQALSFSSVVPWVSFSVSDKDPSMVEGLAPLTSLYQKEIALALQPKTNTPDWGRLFSGATYVAQLSLPGDALSNQTIRSFVTSWTDAKEQIDTGSYWDTLTTPLSKSGFDLKKHLLAQSTGEVAFGLFGVEKSSERFLTSRSTPGARQAASFSLRSVGVINSVLELLQMITKSSILEFAAIPGNVVAIQMKSAADANAVLTAIDALADPKAASVAGNIRALAAAGGREWRFAAREDILLIGGRAEDLEAMMTKSESSTKREFPFEANRAGAFLDLDVVLEFLAQKEEARQNPKDAEFYRSLAGKGPLWFSLQFEGGFLKYSARIP